MREGTRKKPEGPGVFHGFRHIYFLVKENAIFKLRYVLSCTCNVSESPWYTLSLLSSVVHAMDTMCQTVAYKRLKPKNGNRPFQLVCLNLFYHFRPRDGTAKNFSFKFCPIHVHACAHVCTIYETTKANSLENITLTEVGNKTSKLKRCIIIKHSPWKVVPVAYTRW